MSEILIEVRNLGRVFHTGGLRKAKIIALENITFDLKRGETIGVTGPSGSGKTTLGKIIAGIDRPTSGEVGYLGRRITELAGKERHYYRRHVHMLFQDAAGALNPLKTTGASIKEVAKLAGLRGASINSAVAESLRAVHLSHELLSRTPDRLSGGQNQRIALARILMLSPEVIVLDEPTSALDVSVQAGILRLLKEIQRERKLGYLFISHDEAVIEFMCDTVISLKKHDHCRNVSHHTSISRPIFS